MYFSLLGRNTYYNKVAYRNKYITSSYSNRIVIYKYICKLLFKYIHQSHIPSQSTEKIPLEKVICLLHYFVIILLSI